MKRSAQRSGFSLVEIMVVSAIFAITAVGVLGILSESYRMNIMARETTIATEAIRNKIEEIRTQGHSGALNFNNTKYAVSGLGWQHKADTEAPANDPNYWQNNGVDLQTGEVMVISVVADQLQPEVYVITVTLFWRGVIGNRTLTSTTRIADDGTA